MGDDGSYSPFVFQGAFRTLRKVFYDKKGLKKDFESVGDMDSSQGSNICD